MKRFSIVNNGYNMDEVNRFVDEVIKRLEKLSQENSNYLSQLESLKKESNQGLDLKVSKALLAAQETTDKMKELAKAEAELIVKEAKDNDVEMLLENYGTLNVNGGTLINQGNTNDAWGVVINQIPVAIFNLNNGTIKTTNVSFGIFRPYDAGNGWNRNTSLYSGRKTL